MGYRSRFWNEGEVGIPPLHKLELFTLNAFSIQQFTVSSNALGGFDINVDAQQDTHVRCGVIKRN